MDPRKEGWFDDEVDAYERARPSYPDALFDDLFAHVEAIVRTRPEVLEIGAGTGKATAGLLARGAVVVAVEPGAKMAALLRSKFVSDDTLQVVNARFEDADLPASAFDIVVAATSFHWIDPAVRLTKSQRMLRPGGVLAVIETNQIASSADRGFFERCFPLYLRYRPDEVQSESPGEDITPPVFGEIADSGLFETAKLHRYRWDQRYATAMYADLVRSYSGTQLMPPDAREALIADLCELIDQEFDGYVVRPLVMTLVLARKLG